MILTRLRRLVGLAPPPAVAESGAESSWGAWTPDASWLARRRAAPATYVSVTDAARDRIVTTFPGEVRALVDRAERFSRHEFDLLGSGRFVATDPDRSVRDGYQPIDWFLDPVRGLRFPRDVHHKSWNLQTMRPGMADVKLPWELARGQHLVTLGQAFRLTSERRWAGEALDQMLDFIDANPLGRGVNWTCTMDVGLRAVSWVIALDLIRTATIDEARAARAYAALFDHGRFIRANLENTYEVTSNHFLSNVVGLWFLAATFADLDEAREWGSFARQAIEQEIDVQVLPDGADFESSVPYHRLVAELFAGSLRLGDVCDLQLSDRLRRRVASMIEYLAAVMRPDGLMPQAGDADDGRLHVLRHAPPQDARHLLGPGAVMFERPAWRAQGGLAAAWEAAWWGFDVTAPEATVVPPVATLFPDAGLAVVRNDGFYLLITNGVVGTQGFGNHKHNDQLSFEFHAGGPLIVDPGSYVYTSDPDARNLFRSVAYHNTLMIDGAEQNKINPEWLFRMFEQARAEHLAFDADAAMAEYHGRHRGYEALPDPVIHERRFRFERRTGRLEILDRVTGHGRHQCVWHFHFAPGVTATLDGSCCRLEAAWGGARLEFPDGCDAAISGAHYSPSYGVRVECQALSLGREVVLTGAAEWRFALAPRV